MAIIQVIALVSILDDQIFWMDFLSILKYVFWRVTFKLN